MSAHRTIVFFTLDEGRAIFRTQLGHESIRFIAPGSKGRKRCRSGVRRKSVVVVPASFSLARKAAILPSRRAASSEIALRSLIFFELVVRGTSPHPARQEHTRISTEMHEGPASAMFAGSSSRQKSMIILKPGASRRNSGRASFKTSRGS